MRVSSAAPRWFRLLSYPFRSLIGIVFFAFRLIISNRKSIVHLSGFAGITIFNEFVIILISKILGYKIVYELRGGGIIENYKTGSQSYKKLFTKMLNWADYIFSQGKENFPLIQSLSETPIFYYPNFVENSFSPNHDIKKNDETINLIFFGRMEPEKNVKLIVDVAKILQGYFPNVTLMLIGNGQKTYVDDIIDNMNRKLKKGTYSYLPGCSHDKMKEVLYDKHFFIFPSQQIREGQSNSVTEAMCYGVIPIVSSQGFSPSTVDCEELVVEEISAVAYADTIANIVKLNKIYFYSNLMQSNFKKRFTEDVVLESLTQVYSELF